jgi:hypothetical protein
VRPLRRVTNVARARFCVEAFKSQFVRQGGILNCDFSELDICNLNITAKWQDHCEISYAGEDDNVEFKITEDQGSNQITIKGTSIEDKLYVGCNVDITVPEYVDLNVDANNLNLVINNKVWALCL